MTISIAGPIGPFLDRVQQRQVPVTVAGTCEVSTNAPVPNPAQFEQHVQMQLLRAIHDVVSRKMGSDELTFRHLGTGDVAAVLPEIVAVSGLGQQGIAVNNVSLAFGIDGHPPQPPRGPQAPAPPQHNLQQGTFDLGGGAQLRVKIDGKTPENFLKDKASGMIWGWIIGAVILGIIVLGGIGLGIYIYVAAKQPTAAASEKAAAAAKWDGKSTFECGGNDIVTLSGVTATAGVKAGANCQLTLSGVTITAPVGIDASGNAKVTMSGGSIVASTNSVVASANAKVDIVGAKVTGKSKASGAAKITGAP